MLPQDSGELDSGPRQGSRTTLWGYPNRMIAKRGGRIDDVSAPYECLLAEQTTGASVHCRAGFDIPQQATQMTEASHFANGVDNFKNTVCKTLAPLTISLS